MAHPDYREAARRLGAALARAGITVVYGGGASGSMGALADGALSENGNVIGVIPRFMNDLEWAHGGLSSLTLVDNMHDRKRMMIEDADAVVALPGGCGTLEELFEAITWKRLGLFTGPIVMVNTRGFFDLCAQLLERSVEERFMNPRHLEMWRVVNDPDEVIHAISTAPHWDHAARAFAVATE